MCRFKVSMQSTGEQFRCGENENLLQGMNHYRVGVPILKAIPVGCRGGGCGICKIKVVSGDFVTGKMSKKHVTDNEGSQGYTLACRAFPRSDLVFEV